MYGARYKFAENSSIIALTVIDFNYSRPRTWTLIRPDRNWIINSISLI